MADLCRMCARDSDSTLSLLHTENQQLQWTVRKLNIPLDNGYPTKVCAACYQQMCKWKEFLEKAAKSQNKTLRAETSNLIQADENLNVNKISNENDLVKKFNLKSFSVNITKLSENDIEQLKSRKDDHTKVQLTYSTGQVKQKEVTQSFTSSASDKTYSNKKRSHDQCSIQCKECGKKFKSKNDVKRHMIAHSSERNFKCGQCDMTYKSKQMLLTHIKRHSFLRNFKCKQCNKKFKLQKDLTQHMLVHSNIRPYSCKICSKSFKTKRCVRIHKIVHIKTHDIKCNLCSAAFKTKNCYLSHIKFKHSDARPFKCYNCGQSFKNKASVSRHMMIHLNLRKFKCDECGFKFNLNMTLKRHKLLHSNNAPTFQCNICQCKFKRKDQLKSHMQYKKHFNI